MNATGQSRDEPVNLTTLTADDLMLEVLGQGGRPASEEGIVDLLAAWRVDLTSEEPGGLSDAELLDLVRAELPAPRPPSPPATDPTPLGRHRGRLRFILAAAAAVIVLASLGIGIGRAGPTSPLWPLVKMVQPQLAEVRAAEQAIAQARTAASAGRQEEARHLLDQAAGHVSRIDDSQVASRLQDEIDQLRDMLARPEPDVSPGGSTPGASTAPAPGGSTPTADPSGAQATGQPEPGPEPDQPLDPLLPLPLPSLPLPELSPLLPILPPLLDGDGKPL